MLGSLLVGLILSRDRALPVASQGRFIDSILSRGCTGFQATACHEPQRPFEQPGVQRHISPTLNYMDYASCCQAI